MGSMTCSLAQNVTILHMKDGTTRRYTNGTKEATNIRFYEYAPAETATPHYTTTHDNGYQATWDVNQVWKIDGKYVVGLFWQSDIPNNFQARHGVCFGTKPGLTVDDCDNKTYATDLNGYPGCHYMVIGEKWKGNMEMTINVEHQELSFYIYDNNNNRIITPLELGQTYYYRTFAECQVEQNGQQETTVLYGAEQSFKVPKLMTDFGYANPARFSSEALEAFAKHFPAGVTAPTWEQMESLWNLWLLTDEAKQMDLSADISSMTFDDGQGYIINHIPDEFYTWITNREIVIDPLDGIYAVSQIENSQTRELEPTITPQLVSNVDASWGVPGNRYVRFEPNRTTVNHSVTYRSGEAVAGVPYDVIIVFAPETVDSSQIPTKVNVNANAVGSESSNQLISSLEVPADKTTNAQVAEKFSITSMGIDLIIKTNTKSSEFYRNKFSRTMRIAEIRLIPRH
jgi:hypothetical protein